MDKKHLKKESLINLSTLSKAKNNDNIEKQESDVHTLPFYFLRKTTIIMLENLLLYNHRQ